MRCRRRPSYSLLVSLRRMHGGIRGCLSREVLSTFFFFFAWLFWRTNEVHSVVLAKPNLPIFDKKFLMCLSTLRAYTTSVHPVFELFLAFQARCGIALDSAKLLDICLSSRNLRGSPLDLALSALMGLCLRVVSRCPCGHQHTRKDGKCVLRPKRGSWRLLLSYLEHQFNCR